MSLNNKPYMVRPTLIDLSHVEIKYYPFSISLEWCNRRCNSVNDLPLRICLPSKTKGVNVKVFSMITNRNESKTLKSFNSNKKKNVNMCIKIILHAKEIIHRILVHVFARMTGV